MGLTSPECYHVDMCALGFGHNSNKTGIHLNIKTLLNGSASCLKGHRVTLKHTVVAQVEVSNIKYVKKNPLQV